MTHVSHSAGQYNRAKFTRFCKVKNYHTIQIQKKTSFNLYYHFGKIIKHLCIFKKHISIFVHVENDELDLHTFNSKEMRQKHVCIWCFFTETNQMYSWTFNRWPMNCTSDFLR